MKGIVSKRWIALANIGVMGLILGFVFVYLALENNDVYRKQVASFTDNTVTMERVTENYLEGEQGICDVWTHYINSKSVSLEEATEFIRSSHVVSYASAHLIYRDSLTGLSTRPAPGSSDQYDVSYQDVAIFANTDWIKDQTGYLNVSRAFVNPLNGVQSLAFCNPISVIAPGGSGKVDALLLRIVPLADLEAKWIYPKENFAGTEFSLIDADGNYITHGASFTQGNFFDFYQANNPVDQATLEKVQSAIKGVTGNLEMKDGKGQACVIAHTPVSITGRWTLLSYIPSSTLRVTNENWILIGVVSLGLAVLFVIDMLYMLHFNRKLRQISEVAESANRAKTDFLSTMSHDIRTPMNAIVGLTTIAEKNVEDTEAVKEYLRKISLASNHLLTLINDILDISKVESGKLTLSPLTFSMVEAVENLVNISQPMIKEKNIDFAIFTQGIEKEYLYADELRLNQIYINILSNAIKYTEPGGKVRVNFLQRPSSKEGCVELTCVVSDTGMGMTPEFMERMYQPFSRQTDSRVNSIQGTGLGLAITKQMVELMDGRIECESEVGKGTTFTIVLDIPIAERQLEDLRLDGLDVLLVDDDPVQLETGAETLRLMGANPLLASNGPKAIEIVNQEKVDAIIMDWKMDGMDGLEAMEAIRSSGKTLPIYLASAYDWSDIEEKAKAIGVSGFIGKPLFRSTIYERLSPLLGVEAKPLEKEDRYEDIGGMHILIAEDNDLNFEIIESLLGMYDITVERAQNGKIALEMIENAKPNQFDLVFMDIQMPEMNGLDATKAIRALNSEYARTIPIIAMTADAFSENVSACFAAGMDGHIAKPVDIKLVVKEIRRIKERKDK